MEHKEYHRQVFETIFTQFDTEVPSYSLIDNDIEEILKEIEKKVSLKKLWIFMYPLAFFVVFD